MVQWGYVIRLDHWINHVARYGEVTEDEDEEDEEDEEEDEQ
jgi:hypothetical protein